MPKDVKIKTLKIKYCYFLNNKGECKYAEYTFNQPLSCFQDQPITKLHQ